VRARSSTPLHSCEHRTAQLSTAPLRSAVQCMSRVRCNTLSNRCTSLGVSSYPKRRCGNIPSKCQLVPDPPTDGTAQHSDSTAHTHSGTISDTASAVRTRYSRGGAHTLHCHTARFVERNQMLVAIQHTLMQHSHLRCRQLQHTLTAGRCRGGGGRGRGSGSGRGRCGGGGV
jgi:hypothetical protein